MKKETKIAVSSIIGVGGILFGVIKFEDWMKEDRRKRFNETYKKAFDDGWNFGYRNGLFYGKLGFDE